MKTRNSVGFLIAVTVLFVSCSVLGDIEDLRAKVIASKSFSVAITGDKWHTGTLTASVTASSGIGTPAYEWFQRDSPGGTATPIGTASTYIVDDSDRDKYISVKVTYSLLEDAVESALVKIHPGEAINSYMEFKSMASAPATPHKQYILLKDIDFDAELTGVGTDKWDPSSFDHSLDGNGHEINLGIDDRLTSSSNYYGLFETVDNYGEVKNLRLKGSFTHTNTTETYTVYFGSVAGRNYGKISNVYSTVNISLTRRGSIHAGGIVGEHGSTVPGETAVIENCYYGGNISGQTSSSTAVMRIGGIAGHLTQEFKILNCWSSGTVSATGGLTSYTSCGAGGIGGFLDNYSAENAIIGCAALGASVTGGGSYANRILGAGATLGEEISNFANSVMAIIPGHSSGVDGSPISLLDANRINWWRSEGPGWTVHNSKTAALTALAANPDASPWVWDTSAQRPVLWFMMP